MPLSSEKRDELLAWYDGQLRGLAEMSGAKISEMKPLAFISGCLARRINPHDYEEERRENAEFAKQCESRERWRDELIGGTAFTTTVAKGRASDMLVLAQARQPDVFTPPKEKNAGVINILVGLGDKDLSAIEVESERMDDEIPRLLDARKRSIEGYVKSSRTISESEGSK